MVGEDQFFFTNYYYMSDTLELLLDLHWGSFGYFDGARSTLLNTELFVPNGIAISPDERLTISHNYCSLFS